MPVTGWKKPFTSPPAPSWPGWANAAAGAKMKKIANVVTAARFMSKLHRHKSFDDASYLGAFTYLTSRGDACRAERSKNLLQVNQLLPITESQPIGPRSNAVSLNVRFGSKADICSAKRHVRFTPNSGH